MKPRAPQTGVTLKIGGDNVLIIMVEKEAYVLFHTEAGVMWVTLKKKLEDERNVVHKKTGIITPSKLQSAVDNIIHKHNLKKK